MGRTTRYPSTAGFIVDPNSVDRSSGRQIDWANVGPQYRETPGTPAVTVVVGVAGAAQNATSVPVAALSAAIPNGTTLDFGGAKFARLTAAAAAGATALTVAALVTALVSGDTATYAGTPGAGNKVLKSGTVVGELLGSGKVSPRVASTNPAVGMLETDAVENDPVASKTGYGMIVGGEVYENLLPDSSGGPPRVLLTAIKTELNTAGASKGFLFQQYLDNRG
jgi:hypothetical protein